MGLNRFLIRRQVHCKNLASHLIAQSLCKVKKDMEQDHGIQIWIVETFVDSEHEDPARGYSDSCFVAAGFENIGKTSERRLTLPPMHASEPKRMFFV